MAPHETTGLAVAAPFAGDAKLVARDGDFKLMRGEAGHREAEPRASRLSAACRTRSRMQGG